MAFGQALKTWRTLRGFSQMPLANSAGISPRHVSFLETGRSTPTEGMVLRLSDTLHLPLREKNGLLAAAGFSRRFEERCWDDEHIKAQKEALELILTSHNPYPALALDRGMNVLQTNEGFGIFISLFPEIPEASANTNFVELILAPGPMKDAIENWQEVAGAIVARLRSHVWVAGKNDVLEDLLQRILQFPDVEAAMHRDFRTGNNFPMLLTHIKGLDGTKTSWFSTITTFGTAQDVMLDEIWIEQFHPANDVTRALLSKQ